MVDSLNSHTAPNSGHHDVGNEGQGSAMLSCVSDSSRRYIDYLLIGNLPMSPQMNRLLQI